MHAKCDAISWWEVRQLPDLRRAFPPLYAIPCRANASNEPQGTTSRSGGGPRRPMQSAPPSRRGRPREREAYAPLGPEAMERTQGPARGLAGGSCLQLRRLPNRTSPRVRGVAQHTANRGLRWKAVPVTAPCCTGCREAPGPEPHHPWPCNRIAPLPYNIIPPYHETPSSVIFLDPLLSPPYISNSKGILN